MPTPTAWRYHLTVIQLGGYSGSTTLTDRLNNGLKVKDELIRITAFRRHHRDVSLDRFPESSIAGGR